MIIRKCQPNDIAPLTDIWLNAVRATHHFLNEEDIQFYLPQVKETYIPSLEVWVIENESRVLGFIGLDNNKVEMLFIDTNQHQKGVGKKLLLFAQEQKGLLTVDVNEQNPGAHAFYLKCGFKNIGRSELDPSGKPFPIIHMAQ